ncbi:hypothetical protein MFIFM68171_06067 [Madurella fahalii]|uniref:Uncharacterized protein n=1 Tax=Madurella fahalii TaxID=1157608 RepID=A0ABQ0GDN9_9PEZI
METKISFPRGSFDIQAYNKIRVYIPFSLLPSLDYTICPEALTASHSAEDIAARLYYALNRVMTAIGHRVDSSAAWTRDGADADYRLERGANGQPRAIAFTMERHPTRYVPAFLRRPAWVECADTLRDGVLECDAYMSPVLAV